MIKFGIIGGSGLYEIDSLTDAEWVDVDTPWGKPSDQLLSGKLQGVDIVFLPRHGRGHVHAPDSINFRANIDALKRLGVTHVLSVSACGSFREEMAPGDFVMVDQFVDRTTGRASSFFGSGCVAHVSMAFPVCIDLSRTAAAAARAAGIKVHEGGTYLAMAGPQFSTLAESRIHREVMGCDVVGMTNMPEAALAREAEMCYAVAAMVTDYDSWHPRFGEVDLAEILSTLKLNQDKARQMIENLPKQLSSLDIPCAQSCDTALELAIITAPDKRDPSLLKKLDAVAGRVLKS